ncbi:MAG: VanW family protein [Anaerolineales bacterium]|nr:VanW family protein [Anaerolineales bacterium]
MTAPTLSLPRASVPRSVWLLRLLLALVTVGAVAGALTLAGVALYDLAYRGRIYPGVRTAGVDLSGLKPEEAALALAGRVVYPQQPAFILSDGELERTYTPGDLGVSFDVGATVLAAYQVGRAGQWPADWQAQYQAWHAGAEIAPVLVLDEGRTRTVLERLADETYRPVVEASLQAQGTTVTATPGQVGRALDLEAVLAELRGHLLRTEKAALALPYLDTAPLVLDASAQAEAARALLSAPLTLTITAPYAGDPGPWTLTPEQVAGLLRITRISAGANAARFELTLDPAGLRAILEPLAEPLQRDARDARFIFNDDTRQLEVIQPALAARELDLDASIAAVNAAVAQGAHTAPLVFHTTPPQITDDLTAEQLGITELVSEQFTSFRGSSAERLNNIQVAAARFHGLLIPPGAVFSFSDNIGDISLDSGFAEALIIYGGRTIRGVGGGVCQVSTTLFRAVWFGGYPLVERNSHAYRVGYYEQKTAAWAGPGLDAAVYTPLVDFKFQNDRDTWLLMETYFYPTAGQLVWKFYSTPDGREVQVSGPVVENVVPAPEAAYEENPELPAGEIKQVDYAADGADVTVTRTVTRAGVPLNAGEAPLRTHYQPWRAIYQYGPGTEGIPTPTPPAP